MADRGVFRAGVIDKLAAGWNSSVTETTNRDGPQTEGEAGTETSSPGVSGQVFNAIRKRPVRGPGNQGRRGVGEWYRQTKYLGSKSTW